MSRCGLWFGTVDRMRWVETPLSGADSTPVGWRSGGELLNGGGWVDHSWGSHKTYNYSWRNSSARHAAQLMKSYRDGVFGRGLIYFIDPLIYDTNVLPAQWAAPGITLANEGTIQFPSTRAYESATYAGERLDLPTLSASWSFAAGVGEETRKVFIPIPEGHVLHLGGFYTGVGAAPVYQIVSDLGDELPEIYPVPQLNPEGQEVVSSDAIVGKGIMLYLKRYASDTSGNLTVQAITGRIRKAGLTNPTFLQGPWVGGQGHSGCRFDGEPTYIEYTGVNGGQVGYAASFREVGSWV